MATYQSLYDIISKASSQESRNVIKGTNIPLDQAQVQMGNGGEVQYWYGGQQVQPEFSRIPYTDYAPNASYGPTQVDPNFTQDVKMRILQDNYGPLLDKMAQMPDGMPGTTEGAGDLPWAVWRKEPRDVWEVLNAPNAQYLDSYFRNVAGYRANEAEPNFIDQYLFPATVGAITGGALTGAALPTANALMAGASFTPTFSGGALSGLMNTLTGQAASTAASQAAGAGASAAAGGSGSAAGGAAAAGGAGSTSAFFDNPYSDGASGWTTGTTPLPNNFGSTLDVSGQLPLNSFPGQTASLAGTLASLGISPAQAASLGLTAANGGNGGSGQGFQLSDLLRGIPGVLGAIGASQQADAVKELGNKYFGIGAPSRQRYEASFQPGFSMANEPGYADALDQTTRAFTNRNSVGTGMGGVGTAGPNAWSQTLKDVGSTFAFPALQQYRNQNSATGGFGAFNAAATGADMGAIAQQGQVFSNLGGAAGDIFSPPKKRTLAELLGL